MVHTVTNMEGTLCSQLINKIGGRLSKHSKAGQEDQSKTLNNQATGSPPNNGKKKDSDTNPSGGGIQAISKKIKKINGVLPTALQSDDAYQPGDKKCKTCIMTKEQYKKYLQSARVIDLLVDGVVEKEQSEQMEAVEEDAEVKTDSKNSSRSDKITLSFAVYCEGDVIKHNLKCVLMKLQQTVGDIMVQICFVKTRQLGNQERYKKFNVASADLKLLKYEYANLTDMIVPLFKNPPGLKESDEDICIACIKEKLCDYNKRLENILKTGRNVKVVMRNDLPGPSKEPCCFRKYPHIHADVQGKPLVLKYAMPFQVTNSGNPPYDTNSQMTIPSAFAQVQHSSHSLKSGHKSAHPYFEWPSEFPKTAPSSMESTPDLVKKDSKTSKGDIKSLCSNCKNAMTDSPQEASTIPLDPSSKTAQLEAKESPDKSYTRSKSHNKTTLKSPKPVADPPAKSEEKVTPTTTTSILSKDSLASVKTTDLTKPTKNQRDIESELSGSDSNEESTSKTPPKSKKLKAVSELGESSDDSSRGSWTVKPKHGSDMSLHSKKSTKKVSFDVGKNPAVYSVIPSQSQDIFQSKPINLFDDENIQKTCDTEDESEIAPRENNIRDDGFSYVGPTDSLMLAKERLSHIASRSDLPPTDPLNELIQKPEYEIRVATAPTPNLTHIGQPQNKKVDQLLKHFDKEELKNVSSPAECCKASNYLFDNVSVSHLPYSASLSSLPLDASDFDYLATATGKQFSYDDIILLAEEEELAKPYEWETHFELDNISSVKTKWALAFGENDSSLQSDFGKPQSSQENTTTGRRSSSKGVTGQSRDEVLPTIHEEVLTDDERLLKGPFASSSDGDEKAAQTSNKNPRASILKHTTMELRYFTVEFSKELHNKTNEGEHSSSNVARNTQVDSPLNLNKLNSNISHQPCSSNRSYDDEESNDSFHSSSSNEALYCVNTYDKNSNNAEYNIITKSLDEMIMMSAIYLCSENYDGNSYECTSTNKLNNQSSESCVSSLTKLGESKAKLLSMGGVMEKVNDDYVKCLITSKSFAPAGKVKRKKSYTVFQNSTHKFNNSTTTSLSFNCGKNANSIYPVKNKSYTVIKNSLRYTKGCSDSATSNGDTNYSKKMDTKHTISESSPILKKQQSLPTGESFFCKGRRKIVTKSKPFGQPHIMVGLNSCKKSSINFLASSKKKETVTSRQQLNNVPNAEQTSFNHKMSRTVNLNSLNTLAANELKNIVPIKNTSSPAQKKSNLKNSNWSKLKLNNAAVREYINSQLKDGTENKFKRYKELRRKPMLKLGCLEYKRTECEIGKSEFKFAVLWPVHSIVDVLSIVYRCIKIKRHDYIMTKDSTENEYDTYPLLKNTNLSCQIETFQDSKENFGLEKSYISVRNSVPPRIEADLAIEIYEPTLKYAYSDIRTNIAGEFQSVWPTSPSEITTVESAQHNGTREKSSMNSFKSSRTSLTSSDSENSTPKEKIDEYYLIDQHCNPLNLFDSKGRPLTDNSGRPLQNLKGDWLILFDKNGLPLSDINCSPIYDVLGQTLDQIDFDSTKTRSQGVEVLRSLTTDTGDPLVLYDVEGRPLTSVSGTMLTDASGKGLVQFGCTGNPVSDYNGRPIYDKAGNCMSG